MNPPSPHFPQPAFLILVGTFSKQGQEEEEEEEEDGEPTTHSMEDAPEWWG